MSLTMNEHSESPHVLLGEKKNAQFQIILQNYQKKIILQNKKAQLSAKRSQSSMINAPSKLIN